MRVLDPGHTYVPYYLDNVDENGEQLVEPNTLQFVKRIGDKFPGNTGEPVPGTTCQEVLRVLIDRVKYLENQIPCEENKVILNNLRDAINLFEFRAASRHGVDYEMLENVEFEPTCPQCGHLFGCDCFDMEEALAGLLD